MSPESVTPTPTSASDSMNLAVLSPTDPKARKDLRAQLRAAEWAMHRKLMAAAETALDSFLANPHRVTAQDVVRLTQLGLELGRSACGLLPGQSDDGVCEKRTISVEFRAAIEKIYGRPVPPQFIEAESQIESVAPAAVSSDHQPETGQ